MEQQKNKMAISKKLGWLSIGLCGLCCALPIVGVAVGTASLTAILLYVEKFGVLALVLAVFLFGYNMYRKRKKAKACATSCDPNCDCKADSVQQTNKSNFNP